MPNCSALVWATAKLFVSDWIFFWWLTDKIWEPAQNKGCWGRRTILDRWLWKRFYSWEPTQVLNLECVFIGRMPARGSVPTSTTRRGRWGLSFIFHPPWLLFAKGSVTIILVSTRAGILKMEKPATLAVIEPKPFIVQIRKSSESQWLKWSKYWHSGVLTGVWRTWFSALGSLGTTWIFWFVCPRLLNTEPVKARTNRGFFHYLINSSIPFSWWWQAYPFTVT